MNKDNIIKNEVNQFQKKFGIFRKQIQYETIDEETKPYELLMFIDDSSKKEVVVFVHVYHLFCMIFGEEETERFYFLDKNPHRSFLKLEMCTNGLFFSNPFIDRIKNGRILYDHFVNFCMDGALRFGSSLTYITNSFLDDFFINPSPDLHYLRKIISNKDPSCYGLWERLILQKYQDLMPNVITRTIRHAVVDSESPLLTLRIIFATMVSEEPAVRRIIEQQLKYRDDPKVLEFFKMHFVPFMKTTIDILINYPYYHDEMQWVFAGVVARVQFAWRSKSVFVCNTTINRQKQIMEELATNARIKKAAKKSKSQTKRGKRNNQKKTRIGRRGRQ